MTETTTSGVVIKVGTRCDILDGVLAENRKKQ